MHRKVYPGCRQRLEGVVKDGMTLMCGGFGLCGIPEKLIAALHDSGVQGPDRGVEQRRRRRRRARAAAQDAVRSAR